MISVEPASASAGTALRREWSAISGPLVVGKDYCTTPSENP